MKSRFSTIDIAVVIQELKKFLGMRVINVYDIDNKTYLIRVGRPDEKTVILLESGTRLHSTEFDWPKNPAPSGFSMKLRKHLKGRRFESINQLGVDRIVDLQFGSGEAAYHIILELYDRGNMVLTDHEFTILTLLRPRTDVSEDVRFAVREKYPAQSGKTHQPPSRDGISELLRNAQDGETLKKILIPHVDYGPAIIDHVLLGVGFPENVKIGRDFDPHKDILKLMDAIQEAESLLEKFITEPCQGYIIQKKDRKPNPKAGEVEDILLYEEFHPFLFRQHCKCPRIQYDRFDQAVDEFFSKMESQRLDLKVIQQEKSVLKKLENVKKDHERRIQGLQKEQEVDILRGQLIEMNLDLVDQAILTVRSAVANQIDWTEIWNLVKEAQVNCDPVATAIKALKLDTNQITLLLHDPYIAPESGENEETIPLKPMRIDIDLGLSAYGNSRRFFEKKKQAAKKEQKTVEASNKAFKSAERKTHQTLKEVATAASINKTRKTYWFEKFLWFISSENYLIIGGRDQQQNELIVKRYLKQGDLYVHADLHGASSCIVKNPGGNPVPPKTLNEAGTMAICNSAAWDSKVVTSAWWVYHDQVSKTAPSGEYLTTGSFMIRGKKNYLPPSYLIYGFGFLFKLEESSIDHHKGERRVRGADDDTSSTSDSVVPVEQGVEDIDLPLSDNGESSEENDSEKISTKHPNQGTGTLLNDVGAGEIKEIEKACMHKDPDENEDNTAVREDTKMIQQTGADCSASPMCAAELTEGPGEKKFDFVPNKNYIEEFPDTSISLLHIKGDKYELHREIKEANAATDVFFLGDDVPVVLGQKITGKGGKLSAKQRREIRKQNKGQIILKGSADEEDNESWLHPNKHSPETKDESEDNNDNKCAEDGYDSSKDNPGSTETCPPKRGQRAKRKKIKQKYADQDEEERRLRMNILASAGAQKDDKKKKAKQGSALPSTKPQHHHHNPKPCTSKMQAHSKEKQPKDFEYLDEAAKLDKAMESGNAKGSAVPEREEADSDGDKVEESNVGDQDEAILNSLTGLPLPEDELLYAVPVCAPYNALINYKFRVKLMPGSTKKGKAVKTALNVFIYDKSASSREKDLLKIQKDVDLARLLPGKVKVAAPNLHKKKR